MTDSDVGGRPKESEARAANSIAGDVTGTSLQTGTIHGGVHFHRSAGPQDNPVPRQLKPVPAHFTARADELAELERIAAADQERRGPVVAVISGQGGVGKSALALRWLHDVAHRFPDGQLYTDLTSDVSSTPALLTSVLSRFLRAFGVTGERIPVDIGEAAALFRSLTAGKRVSMLVDNPTSAAQVRVLLPASPLSVVVVASRWRLGGLAMDGAGFLPLVPLPRTAGAEMLARTVGRARVAREPEAVTRLVELCGGLPIALSIAGARLTTRPAWPLARVVRELTDEQRRLSALSMERDLSVTSVFDLSYDGLSAQEALAYRRLGLHPGPFFTVDAAAAVLDTSADGAMDLLDTLVNASLLDMTDVDAYRFHDLVRLHARERAIREDTEIDRVSLLERTLRYYLRFAATADQVVSPLDRRIGPVFQEPASDETTYPNAEAALSAMEDELPNLLAVLRAGAHLGLDELVWQVCEAMWSLFLRRKHFADWIATYQLGIAAATRCGNDAARSRMHRRLGIAFHNLDRADDAVAEGMAAVTAARAAGDIGTETEALQLVGMANRSRGRLAEAMAALRESIMLAGDGLPRHEALSRRLLGQALIAVHRPEEAVVELRRARELAAGLSDDHVAANISVWLADALARAGQGPEAIGLLQDAWPTLRESGSSQHKAQLFMVWGWTAERLDDLASARDLLAKAHDLYAEIGAPHARRVRTDLDRVEARIAALASDD
jgi:tetratricopeptide (TPR) repeat protein